MNEYVKMNEDVKREAEILAQLDLIREKLLELRDSIKPILKNNTLEEVAKESSVTNSSEAMYKINRIKDQVDSIIEDVDIN